LSEDEEHQQLAEAAQRMIAFIAQQAHCHGNNSRRDDEAARAMHEGRDDLLRREVGDHASERQREVRDRESGAEVAHHCAGKDLQED